MRLLKPKAQVVTLPFDPLANRATANIIAAVLAEHGQTVSDCLADIRGPTVTRYEFELLGNATIKRIRELEPELGAALLVGNQVRVSGAIPGRPGIGVEVPNPTRDLVTLGDLLARPAPDSHPLTVPLGLDLANEAVWFNLTEGPHGITAGQTGSGKSTAWTAVLCAVLMRSTPDQVRMILVDPKRTEFTCFEGAPHLLKPVCHDVDQAIAYLRWLDAEMTRRYGLLEQSKTRKIDEHNQVVGVERLPYILFAVDEWYDLFARGGKDLEALVLHLESLARAVGIHLYLSTQRPTTDVVTGNVKANSPFRWAFQVAAGVDSMTILDRYGAQQLCGHGDSLLITATRKDVTRLQAPLVTDDEVARVVAWCSDQRAANYLEDVVPGLDKHSARPPTDDELAAIAARLITDPEINPAREIAGRSLKAALLSYHGVDVSFDRVAKILALLHGLGIIGPPNGNQPRKVRATAEQVEQLIESAEG